MANAQHTRSAQGTADEVNLEFDAHRTGAEEGHHPPILVLSRDPNLVETVKKAAPRGTAGSCRRGRSWRRPAGRPRASRAPPPPPR